MAKIEICTGYNEREAVYYRRRFTIVEEMPKVGEKYEGQTVLAIKEVRKDPEQPRLECHDYDCFALSLKPEEEDENGPAEPDLEYIAISRIEPNHMETLIRIEAIVPSIDEANLLIDRFLDRAPELCEEIEVSGIDRSELVQECFGIVPESFEEALLAGSLVRAGSFKPVRGISDPFHSTELLVDPFCIQLRGMVPYWWGESDALDITSDDVEETVAAGAFTARTVRDLHPDVFTRIVEDCDEIGKDWMSEEGCPSWFGMISLNAKEILEICAQITDVCCLPFRNFLKKAGVSQAAFCRKFIISKRTVDDWCAGKNACKTYLRLLFAEKLGLIERR